MRRSKRRRIWNGRGRHCDDEVAPGLSVIDRCGALLMVTSGLCTNDDAPELATEGAARVSAWVRGIAAIYRCGCSCARGRCERVGHCALPLLSEHLCFVDAFWMKAFRSVQPSKRAAASLNHAGDREGHNNVTASSERHVCTTCIISFEARRSEFSIRMMTGTGE